MNQARHTPDSSLRTRHHKLNACRWFLLTYLQFSRSSIYGFNHDIFYWLTHHPLSQQPRSLIQTQQKKLPIHQLSNMNMARSRWGVPFLVVVDSAIFSGQPPHHPFSNMEDVDFCTLKNCRHLCLVQHLHRKGSKNIVQFFWKFVFESSLPYGFTTTPGAWIPWS